MASSSSSRHHQLRHNHSKLPNMGSFLPPPLPLASRDKTEDRNPHPTKSPITPSPEDIYLSKSTHLTPQEVLKRRSHRLKQLSNCYRDYYWSLMEELRVQYRQYVWKYGLSPFQEDEDEKEKEKDELREGDILEGSGETNNPPPNPAITTAHATINNNSKNLLCTFYGCKLKAMALTSFCQLHILSDPKQLLYKPCDYVIKRLAKTVGSCPVNIHE